MKISTQPYKGSRDFYPEEYRLKEYIYNIWSGVCKSYGYEQYDGPFLETFDLYEAKSGEELVNEQLYAFTDRGGRKVAIRPEMTPTLARMVSARLKELTKPIRWYSIPNLWRYEKPQRGRLREHNQLNVDIFGVSNIKADYETICIVIDILKAFGAKEHMFNVRVGNRKLLNEFLSGLNINNDRIQKVSRILDKRSKISREEFDSLLKENCELTNDQIAKFKNFLEEPEKIINELKDHSEGANEVFELMSLFKQRGLDLLVILDPSIVRGFDYYTGIVFEAFDLNQNNPRSLCGGGRYDNLLELFVDQKLPGVGFGMGDVTIYNFLENWNLLPELKTETEFLVTVWPDEKEEKFRKISHEIAIELRKRDKKVIEWLENDTKLDKQLKFADKKGIKNAVIIGKDEIENSTITIKDMSTGIQDNLDTTEFLKLIEESRTKLS